MPNAYRLGSSLIALCVLLSGCSTDPTPQEAALPSLTLEATGPASSATVGETFHLTVRITGDEGITSDHIGAHYWNETQDNPTAAFDDQMGACSHAPGGGTTPNTFHIACTPTEPGWHYVRGHLRLTIGDETLDYWSSEVVVLVTAADAS